MEHLAPFKVKLTADRRKRHNLEAADTCWLYDQEDETCDHILVNCSFAKTTWWETMHWVGGRCAFGASASLQDW